MRICARTGNPRGCPMIAPKNKNMTQNTNTRPTIDYIYNPDNQTKTELIDSFVVRLRTFQRLFADIKESKMDAPDQHHLIEGKRGMGKTTMLLRLGYEIENDSDLKNWLIPIVFNEEEYSIRRLYKLWERVAILLEEKDDCFIGLFDEMDNSFENYKTEEEYEYAILNLLNEKLETQGKKLILFIDNFGDIFSKFKKQEVQRLRTVLQTNINFRIIAASSKVLESFYDSKHPFFEFFKVTRLRGLNKQESQDLLLKLGEAYKQEQIKEILKNQSGRVEALRRLTGGVIRTIILLFEIFIDQKQGSAFTDLEAILDKVTPLYKHRMDDLPAQQQEIAGAIAFAWDAVNANEISQKTRIPSKTVSAQLKQMENDEIITKKLAKNKKYFYQLDERFFNIWYLMRHGRKGDKRKIMWLVRFLEEWCDEGELVARANKHIASLKEGVYNIKGGFMLSEALAMTEDLPTDTQDELLKATRDFLSKNNSEFVEYLSESDKELFFKGIKFLIKKNDPEKALDQLLKMKNKDYIIIGACYYILKDFFKVNSYISNKAEVNGMKGFIVPLVYLYSKTRKETALFLIEEFYPKLDGLDIDYKELNLCYALILLWNNKFNESKFIGNKIILDKEFLKKEHSDFKMYFQLLLAKKQCQFLYEYFTNPQAIELNLKDQFKPIWYTLMYYMQDEHPNEYLRMGSELEETVKEIIAQVEQMQIDYT